MAVFRHGVLQLIAHHGVFIQAVLVRVGREVVVNHAEGLGAVVVVCIDYGKRPVYHIARRQNGMAGAPGLFAPRRHSIALGQIVQLLVGIAHIHHLGKPVANGLLERGLNFVLDDKHHGLKARAPRIKDGIVNNQLAVAAHRVYLLQAAVPAAHTGGHHRKNRFFHVVVLLL